jgi:hypothetical protein
MHNGTLYNAKPQTTRKKYIYLTLEIFWFDIDGAENKWHCDIRPG